MAFEAADEQKNRDRHSRRRRRPEKSTSRRAKARSRWRPQRTYRSPEMATHASTKGMEVRHRLMDRKPDARAGCVRVTSWIWPRSRRSQNQLKRHAEEVHVDRTREVSRTIDVAFAALQEGISYPKPREKRMKGDVIPQPYSQARYFAVGTMLSHIAALPLLRCFDDWIFYHSLVDGERLRQGHGTKGDGSNSPALVAQLATSRRPRSSVVSVASIQLHRMAILPSVISIVQDPAAQAHFNADFDPLERWKKAPLGSSPFSLSIHHHVHDVAFVVFNDMTLVRKKARHVPVEKEIPVHSLPIQVPSIARPSVTYPKPVKR